MLTICTMIELLLLSLSAAFFIPSYADYPNYSGGATCSPRPDNSTTAAFKANLNSLLSVLQEQAPQNYGFYKTTTGRNPDKVYGLVQCRGDVSAQDCATCVSDSVKEASGTCNNSNTAAIWLRWCFLHYSQENFFGQWEASSAGFSSGNTTTDDPKVVTKGMNFMSQLTSEVSDLPFMFKTGSVDVGRNGTRYGLAQCNRDLSRSSCGTCLTYLEPLFNQWIRDRSSYWTTNDGCRMMYDIQILLQLLAANERHRWCTDLSVPHRTASDQPCGGDDSVSVAENPNAGVVGNQACKAAEHMTARRSQVLLKAQQPHSCTMLYAR